MYKFYSYLQILFSNSVRASPTCSNIYLSVNKFFTTNPDPDPHHGEFDNPDRRQTDPNPATVSPNLEIAILSFMQY